MYSVVVVWWWWRARSRRSERGRKAEGMMLLTLLTSELRAVAGCGRRNDGEAVVIKAAADVMMRMVMRKQR